MRRLLFVLTTIYTVMLITRPHEFIPSMAESPLLQILLLASFGVWMLTPDKGTELAQFRTIPVFLFFVWLSLGIGGGWWGGIVPALERLVPPILLCVILTGCVRSVDDLRRYSLVVILCTCIIVLHGHYQRTLGIGWTGSPMIQGRITYSGIFNDPNDIGLLIVMSVAFVFFQLRVRVAAMMRLAMWAALGWLLYGVYLTDSRGTMLAILAILGIEARRKYGNTVVAIAGSGVVAVLFAYTRFSEIDGDEASAENRVEAWYEGVQMLIDNPGFGVGWGMFSDYNFGLTAHNSIVLAMAELGLFGYTFWLALVLLSGLMIYQLAFGENIEVKAPAAAPTWLAKSGSVPVVDPEPPSDVPPITIEESLERLAARAILLAAIGFMVGAFFLSQSYKAMLFMNIGLILGRYLGMREAGIAVPEFRLATRLPMVFGAALASVVGIWVLVRVLL